MMKPTNLRLKKTKQEVFKVLEWLMNCYEDCRKELNSSPKKAMEKTVQTYIDFYEWLQGLVN